MAEQTSAPGTRDSLVAAMLSREGMLVRHVPIRLDPATLAASLRG